MTKSETKNHMTLHRLPTLWATTRDELAGRRAAQTARELLTTELDGYATPADRNDLNALLDNYPDQDVAELRALLNRRSAA
jgi:hypothetical protein